MSEARQAQTHVLEVWGDLACFTRPELKVERFSYPIITPSAARGIFDAIYWEARREQGELFPYFYWQIMRIEAYRLPRYIALRRNEVKDKVPPDRTIRQWMAGAEVRPIWADASKNELGSDEKGRTQRQTMALKDVRYRLFAQIRPHPRFFPEWRKFDECFTRRARRGACFQQPYFGCREFPAYFEALPHDTRPDPAPTAGFSQELGWMLYDVFDLTADEPAAARRAISIFQAAVTQGVLEVPDYRSEHVRRGVEVM